MKTIKFTSTLAVLAAAFAFTTVAFAGPGPQYWNRPATRAPATPITTPPATTCAGCSTTTPVASTDRGPAGKGAHDAAVANSAHRCAMGANGQAHDAAGGAMVCCK